MERNKYIRLVFVLLHVCTTRSQDCPNNPDKNLTCYTDYNQRITCVWNSTHVSDQTDTVCTIHAKKESKFISYSSSCTLQPVDVSRPALKNCTLIFKYKYTFLDDDELSINLRCNATKKYVISDYRPICHLKVNPPGKPDVNLTTISWLPYVSDYSRVTLYKSELQCKQQHQLWSDSCVQEKEIWCTQACSATLNLDLLIQGATYEARARVQSHHNDIPGNWSEWSPTASWVSTIGSTKPPSGSAVGFLHIVGAGATLFALLLAVVVLRTDKTTWVYMAKKIRGPPLPNPENSFLKNTNFQSWLSPHFTSEAIHSYLKPVEITTVEVTSTVDAVTPWRPDAKTMTKKSSWECARSNFCNPSYSDLCTPPPVSLLSAGNLEACAADTPYGPVGSQGEGKNKEQDSNEVREKELEILKLLSKDSRDGEPVQVISDYEKVDKLQVERLRLQSLDSGMCSCEEVSQESMEADSINVTDSHDEEPEGEEGNEEGNGKEFNFQKLFGGSDSIYGKKSIQVCSEYKRVQKLQADSPELPSLDSGVSSWDEEHGTQEESVEDVDKSTESTRFLFPPHPSSALPCPLLSLPLPLSFSRPALSPGLQPLPSHILESIALMSASRPVEPPGDGYMPVRQQEN